MAACRFAFHKSSFATEEKPVKTPLLIDRIGGNGRFFSGHSIANDNCSISFRLNDNSLFDLHYIRLCFKSGTIIIFCDFVIVVKFKSAFFHYLTRTGIINSVARTNSINA